MADNGGDKLTEDIKKLDVKDIKPSVINYTHDIIDKITETEIEGFDECISNISNVIDEMHIKYFGEHGSLNMGNKKKGQQSHPNYLEIKQMAVEYNQTIDDKTTYNLVLRHILEPLLDLPETTVYTPTSPTEREKQKGEKTGSKKKLNAACRMTYGRLKFVEGYWEKTKKVNYPHYTKVEKEPKPTQVKKGIMDSDSD